MRGLILAALVACLTFCLAASNDKTLVIMQVFSSEKNPQFFLTGAQRVKLLTLLQPYAQMDRFACYPQLNSIGLGYQGFTIVDSSNHKCMHLTNVPEVESFLLNQYAGSNTDDLKVAAVVKHATQMIASGVKIVENHSDAIAATITPVRGPDNVTDYNPGKWNISPIQYQNNCYNYGNDVRTDTFAQPGRGTGHRWDYNTCDSVWEAAVRDGLIPYSKTKAPAWTEKPATGHFIALMIWPDVNFHWMRKDASNYWSHKPGGTAVRDYDAQGKKIKDPADADRGPYTTFCGYLVSVPSKMNIN